MIVRAALCAALAVVAVTTAAGSAGGAPARHLDTVTIVSTPSEPAALAFYADARGFFRRHGIDADVKVIEFGTAPAIIASGGAAFGPLDVGGFLSLKSRGGPVKLVVASGLYTPDAPTAVLVAAPGKRFNRARQLVGRHVAVDRLGSIAYVALVKWLKRGGVRVQDVDLAFHPFNDMLGLLTQGTIDAAVMPEPWLTQAKRRGATLVAPVFASVCSGACLMTLWFARSDVDRNLAARFRLAIQDAAAWANRRESIPAIDAILARQTKLEPRVIRAMAHSKFGTRLRVGRAQPWIDAYKELDLIPQSFTAPDLVR